MVADGIFMGPRGEVPPGWREGRFNFPSYRAQPEGRAQQHARRDLDLCNRCSRRGERAHLTAWRRAPMVANRSSWTTTPIYAGCRVDPCLVQFGGNVADLSRFPGTSSARCRQRQEDHAVMEGHFTSCPRGEEGTTEAGGLTMSETGHPILRRARQPRRTSPTSSNPGPPLTVSRLSSRSSCSGLRLRFDRLHR